MLDINGLYMERQCAKQITLRRPLADTFEHAKLCTPNSTWNDILINISCITVDIPVL